MAMLERYATETDDGTDPLLDIGLNAVTSVTSYSFHTIKESEAGRPDYISYRVFGSVDYWREIMLFNGITDVREMINGVEIKIPDRTQFMDAMSKREYAFVDKVVNV